MSVVPTRRALRSLLDRRELIVAPGVFDGISAQLARRTGHVAAYLSAQGYLPAELGDLLRSSAVAMHGEGSGA